MNESCFLGGLWSKSSGEVVCLWGRGEWVYLLWLLHVQTAPNCKVVWCGVCDVTWCLICVCGLNQRLCPVSFPSFLLSFFSLCVSPPFAAVSCDLDEPASWFAHMEEAGFQKVPEDDSTTASRVSCLWELHWDKQDLSAVLFWSLSLTEGWLQSWHDTDFDLNSWFLKNPFYVFVFHFYLFWLFYFFILFSSSL